jgi:hypothetical protein
MGDRAGCPSGQPGQNSRPTGLGAAGLGWFAPSQGKENTPVRLSNLVYGAAGYVLGSRAGRERYEDIVRLARRVAGSQTVQSAAGVAQARVDRVAQQARQAFAAKISGPGDQRATVNGHRG